MARLHLVAPVLAVLLPLAAQAQAPSPESGTTTFRSESLNLRFTYPSPLRQVDASQAVSSGQLDVLGISVDADPALANATACLHPVLLLKTPQVGPASTSTSHTTPDGVTHTAFTPSPVATVLLADLDVLCVSEHGKSSSTDLLARMAEVVDKSPGMSPIAPPSWYNVGWQKIHMAAAQGHPTLAGQPSTFTIFTLGLSTNWNNHLLVWLFTSNDIALLDRITKSTVGFGRQSPAVLYPSRVGNANQAPAP